MNWFIYLIKTPLMQKKQDWAEYKKIKQELNAAKILVSDREDALLRTFLEEEDYQEYNACLKERIMLGRAKVLDGPGFDYTILHFHNSRCINFVPIGNENLCSCCNCPAYEKNKKYYDARQNMNSLINKHKHFWKNKFSENVK